MSTTPNILQSDYTFSRKGTAVQHVNDAKIMVWHADGYPKLRLKILNANYDNVSDNYEFSLTIKIFRTNETLLEPIDEETYNESVYMPSDKIIERWDDLKACNTADFYTIKVYSGDLFLLEDEIIGNDNILPDDCTNEITHQVRQYHPTDFESMQLFLISNDVAIIIQFNS